MPVASEKQFTTTDGGLLHDKRLIDAGTLGLEASVSGQAERYGRGKTSHTIHVWWARRPHGAMRALAFASLMPETHRNAGDIMRELAFASSPDAQVIKEAQRLLQFQYGGAPKVLDVFGGGGTIPYEAALLGAEVATLDYNPLSVFIQKSNLEFAQEALSRLHLVQLVSLVKETGERVLARLREKTADLFPLRDRQSGKGIFAYFWTYRLPCRECGYEFLLMKRPWLSRKEGRRTALSVSDGSRRQTVRIDEIEDNADSENPNPIWEGRNGTAFCPKCKAEHKSPSIQDCSDDLVAVGRLLKRGKSFNCAPKGAATSDGYLQNRERALLEALGFELPGSSLPKWSGIVNAAIYGVQTHSDFLNRRQRLVLLELIGGLNEERARLEQTQTPEIVRYVISALSALVDQLVDWNCRLSMWISQNEQVGRAFCGPGVPMLWDYVETDPVLAGPANLWDKLDRIIAGVAATPIFGSRPKVYQGRAQNLPFGSDTFDAVITDPPYYDNVYYNVLADFFYAWKRPVLQDFCPDLFSSPQCGEEAELVASQFRQGDHERAHEWYCAELTKCLQEVTRVLKPEGILSFVFAHSSVAGWEAIVRSFRHSGLVLSCAEPLSIERRQRPRAMTSEAVNTCFVLVGRKSLRASSPTEIRAVIDGVKLRGETLVPRLRECGWHESDIGMALFAQGVVGLSNASSVTDVTSDREALEHVGDVVGGMLPAFKLQARESL